MSEQQSLEETDEPYFTDEGLPRITKESYCRFLEKIIKIDDIQPLLTEWTERMRSTEENPAFFHFAVFASERLPKKYRDRFVFSMLGGYEMLRRRAIEIQEELYPTEVPKK